MWLAASEAPSLPCQEPTTSGVSGLFRSPQTFIPELLLPGLAMLQASSGQLTGADMCLIPSLRGFLYMATSPGDLALPRRQMEQALRSFGGVSQADSPPEPPAGMHVDNPGILQTDPS